MMFSLSEIGDFSGINTDLRIDPNWIPYDLFTQSVTIAAPMGFSIVYECKVNVYNTHSSIGVSFPANAKGLFTVSVAISITLFMGTM